MAGQLSTTSPVRGLALFWLLLPPPGGLVLIFQPVHHSQAVSVNKDHQPQKHIDYEARKQSKTGPGGRWKTLGGKANLFSHNRTKREKGGPKRFFSIVNKHVVFLLRERLTSTSRTPLHHLLPLNLVIHYVTSDPDDQIFGIAGGSPE